MKVIVKMKKVQLAVALIREKDYTYKVSQHCKVSMEL